MKRLGCVIGSMLLSATLMVVSAAAQQQCPDTCGDGTCSNNRAVSCTSDAQCVAADIDAACPCDTASNHGKHQSCVVHLRNQLRKEGCPTARIASCSARSTCGKAGRVLCCTVTSTGTCTGATSTTAGTCSNSGASCATDADCTVLSGPHISRDATACTDRGGFSSGTGSVCDGCQQPVACCVPSSTAGQPGTCEILTATDCATANGTSTPGAAPTCSGVTCP